jgi:small-conductance mechanosensitive channel
MDLLASDGEGSDLEKQGIVPLDAVKKRVKDLKLALDKTQSQKEQESLNKDIKALQETLILYQSYPKKREWRQDAKILKLRAGIVVQLKALTETMLKMQTAHASIEQNRIALRNVLQMYLDARKNLKKLLDKKYPIKKRKRLSRLMKRLKRRLKGKLKELKKSKSSLKALNKLLVANQLMLEKVRKRMLSPPPVRRPAPRRAAPKPPEDNKKRRRRRRRRRAKKPAGPPPLTASQRRKLEKKQEREARIDQLTNFFRRQEFRRYRMESVYLRLHKQDEELNKEVTEGYVHLYNYMLYRMENLYKLYSAKAEGGLLHQKLFSLNKDVFVKAAKHTTEVVTSSHKQVAGITATIMKAAGEYQKKSGFVLLILVLLVPFVLLGIGFYVRRWLLSFSQGLAERMKEDGEAKQALELLVLAALVTYRLVLPTVIFGGLLFLAFMLNFPKGWTSMLWTVSLTIVTLRAIWLLANQLLADDPNRRVLKIFDDNLTRRFRRTIKWLSGFALFYMPFLELVRVLGYSKPLYDLLNAGFYAVIWFGAVLSFMRKAPPVDPDDPEAAPPRNEEEASNRRWSLILGYRVYPVLLFFATVLFGLYIWGYRNLAGYIGKAALISLFLISISSTIYQGLRALVFWIFGLSGKGKGLIKVNSRVAFYISRLSRAAIAVLLGFFTLGLILEAWQVPGGFKAVFKLINTPFLSVKGTRLSFISIVKFVLVFGGALWLQGWLKRKLSESIYPIFQISPGVEHAANTVVGYIVIIVGVLAGLQVMGMSIGVLAVFAGVIGIGVGFGLQNVANNFISGLIITFGRPVAVGDVIEVGGVYGIVRKISARSMTLETIDSRIVLVPNSQIITSQVINWSLGPPYVWIKMGVGVAYGSDVDLVKKTLLDIAAEHPVTLKSPPPKVVFAEFNSSSLDFILLVAIADPMAKGGILSELRFATNEKFAELDIEMPFPQQDLHLDGNVSEAFDKVGNYFESMQGQNVKTPDSLFPSKSS